MVESKIQARKPINMVFLGETGAGKTTLLTALKDYIEGRTYEERKVTERVFQTLGVSQT